MRKHSHAAAVILPFVLLWAGAATAQIQSKELEKALQKGQEQATLIALHGEAYRMGGRMGAALYYAKITEA